MTGKRILITGGAGYLGQCLVSRFYKDNEIVVFSRDEFKHWKLRQMFPKARTILGDVRNFTSLRKAAHGCQVGFYCASLKHLNQINENVREAVDINILGAINSRIVTEECGMEAACYVSTDKSRLPISIYGATKYIGGQSFIWEAEKQLRPRLSTLVCGNIINSSGSVIPAIWNAIADRRVMDLYGETMTRFMIESEEAAQVCEFALTWNGYNVMPKMRAFRVKYLFDIYKERFGLRYIVKQPTGWVEREHEILVDNDEAHRTEDCKMFYVSHYRKTADNHLTFGIASNDCAMTKEELESYLLERDFFRKPS